MRYLVIKNDKGIQTSKRGLDHVIPQLSEYCITNSHGRVMLHVPDNLDNPKQFAQEIVKVLNEAEKQKQREAKDKKVTNF